MTTGQVVSFLLFAVVAAITPGPSNLILTSTASKVGLRRGLPSLAGQALGMGLLLFLITFGLGNIVLANPLLSQILKWAGVAFLLWLAWRIATSGSTKETADKRPL